ncbi:MAG: FAD-dependent oxidoreductase [Myxococcales bacterium]|nr:FAD-dependent oxidoreductase [Myxococcales bacterium]
MKSGILVVGAGMSGATCARHLRDAGYRVAVVDKGRGPGGRMSTRRIDAVRFDHGAPGFAARSPEFREVVEGWMADGSVVPWQPVPPAVGSCNIENQYVGRPSMNRIIQQALDGLSVRFNTAVTSVEHAGGQFRVGFQGAESRESYDAVVVAIPAPQAAQLLSTFPAIASELGAIQMRPRWVSMVSFSRPLDTRREAFVWDNIEGSSLGSAWRDSAKPGRDGGELWTLQSTPDFSEAMFDAAPDAIASRLLRDFRQNSALELPSIILNIAHRWRYAVVAKPAGKPCVVHDSLPLIAAGDWCLGPCVEDAWHSGRQAAQAMTELLIQRVRTA